MQRNGDYVLFVIVGSRNEGSAFAFSGLHSFQNLLDFVELFDKEIWSARKHNTIDFKKALIHFTSFHARIEHHKHMRRSNQKSKENPMNNEIQPFEFEGNKVRVFAALAAAKEGTLAYWRSAGIGPKFVKVGRIVMYPKEQMIAYFAQHLYQCTAEYEEEVGA
jgi:hypothetical protein